MTPLSHAELVETEAGGVLTVVCVILAIAALATFVDGCNEAAHECNPPKE